MAVATKFRKLLEPYQLGNIKLKNRIFCPAHSRYLAADDVAVREPTIATYEALAAGGVGLIIMELASIDSPLGHKVGHHSIEDDKYIPGYEKLAAAIHKHDCPVILQLSHAGPEQPAMHDFGIQSIAPSGFSKEELPDPAYEPPREITLAEIHDIIEKFARGAERAKKAGFDGVELHAAHNKLLNSFLTLAWNRRTDEYGGSHRNRARFDMEIIQAIKERCGKDFPVGIRINGKEWGHPKGITSEDSQEFSRLFQEAGADYISVSGCGYGDFFQAFLPEQLLYPEPSEEAAEIVGNLKKPGALVPYAEAIKKVVSVPVMVTGRLDPELGEWILEQGKADLIGMARRLLADPELPKKLIEGREDDIAPCTACYECLGQIWERKPAHCRVNAALCRELEYVLKPARKKKKVMVVGGGPAGMEAARVAAMRGHEVSLYEKESKLGGLLPVAMMVKGTEVEDIPGLYRYLSSQINKLGVQVHTGQEADFKMIESAKPDVLIIATGGVLNVPEVPGIEKSIVVSGADLHHKLKKYLRFIGPGTLRSLTRFSLPLGKKVVIMGGLIQGCQLAEFLVKRGRQVTIVESSDELGLGVPTGNRARLLAWLENKGVTMLTGVKYEEVTDRGLVITNREGKKQTIAADNILTALPLKPDRTLYQTVDGKVPEVYLAGDSAEGSKIIDAINDGFRIACSV